MTRRTLRAIAAGDGYPGDHTLGPPVPRRGPPPGRGEAYDGRLVLPDGTPAAPPPDRFPFVGAAAFAGADYRPEWLVTGCLVKDQPGVIAGPSKSLKTSLALDLAVSLAAGRPFLGTFAVPRATRVAVVSGESGPHTLQETATRVCRAKGVALPDLDGRLDLCFALPTFTDPGCMGEFAAALMVLNAQVVVIDPVYLCLGGGVDAANLFSMGAAFRVVADLLLGAGVTPLLCHHANRKLAVGEPMELEHLAYSGLEQFLRQYLFLNRRTRFANDGSHDLWLRVGGSAGHGGLWSLHVEEGVTGDDFSGRRWEVGIRPAGEAFADAIDQRQSAKREAERKKLLKDEAAVLDAIDAEVGAGLAGATVRRIRTLAGLGADKAKAAIAGLMEEGAVAEVEVAKTSGNGTVTRSTGYRRAGSGGRW